MTILDLLKFLYICVLKKKNDVQPKNKCISRKRWQFSSIMPISWAKFREMRRLISTPYITISYIASDNGFSMMNDALSLENKTFTFCKKLFTCCEIFFCFCKNLFIFREKSFTFSEISITFEENHFISSENLFSSSEKSFTSSENTFRRCYDIEILNSWINITLNYTSKF